MESIYGQRVMALAPLSGSFGELSINTPHYMLDTTIRKHTQIT